ncbi:hypothetical protein HYFRA_00002303 [Hymenoscyphus fraxineus]|uniref:Leucine carboxyl methyltransferase 1 n=1 Tax=Hymenoscyphus fraxineus TaxID=746836 RepID=A0A9N9L942_9HELO|nr:hypothetical protein HYFRA_00002303 [Hymenoscyphus fraxineus]
MSAPQIPNLLASRGGPRLRGSRGRGRGGGPARMDASQRKDLDIQSTDTDAAVSRLSAVSVGYLDDPFAPYFVNGPGTRRLPVINRGTYTRTSALDILVDAFLSHASDESKDTPTKQIISLGAGTDTRYFRLRAQNKHRKLVYHEFDFPSVCATKSQLVSTNQALLSEDGTATFFTKRSKDAPDSDSESEWGFAGKQDGETDIRYCCHPLDLRRLPYTPSIKTLDCFHGIRSDIPTLIISECCLCYLEVDNAQEVIKWFADRIPSLGIVLYEPIGVDTSFGQMMVANLASRNITMPTVKMYKTLSDQKQRLSDAGFEATNDDGGQDAKTIEHVWENWVNADEKERVDSLEGLDEVEEWQILARHYAVAWGWRGTYGWENWRNKLEHQ